MNEERCKVIKIEIDKAENGYTLKYLEKYTWKSKVFTLYSELLNEIGRLFILGHLDTEIPSDY